MDRVRFYLCAYLVMVCLAAFVPNASAWEFTLNGQANWTYGTITQQGRQGFFGQYDVDGPFGLPSANFWTGIPRVTTHNLVSGSDKALSYITVSFWPEIRVNPAIRLRGKYRIGGWNDGTFSKFGAGFFTPPPNQPALATVTPTALVDKFNSYYLTGTETGTEVAMAEGHWTMFWATAQTPWGTVGYGKRPKTFGCGLQYDEYNATSESLLLTTNYGPLAFGIGLYPSRLSPTAKMMNRLQFADFDKGEKSLQPEADLEAFVTYSAGPLQLGIFSGYLSWHIGAEHLITNFAPAAGGISSNVPIGPIFQEDTQLSHGSIFLKYNNGRFFFNTEATWLYATMNHPGGGLVTASDSPFGGLNGAVDFLRTYVEEWRYMAELGAMCGPAKLSFLFAVMPGFDRRAGVMIDRQPSALYRMPLLTRDFANVSVWRPYGYILPYLYNSGVPMIGDIVFSPFDFNFPGARLDSANKEGYMLDATVLAARLDYALASNLNFFASFLTAQRTSNGYFWGCMFNNFNQNIVGAPEYTGGNVTVIVPFGTTATPNSTPNIPDSDLGYEVDFGFDWKLLEGWTLGTLIGRWQPGNWFSYACRDRRLNVADPFNGQTFGTVPKKPIDPIWATNITLSVDF